MQLSRAHIIQLLTHRLRTVTEPKLIKHIRGCKSVENVKP